MEYTEGFIEAAEKFRKAHVEALKIRTPVLSIYVMTEYEYFGKKGCEFVYNAYYRCPEMLQLDMKAWPNSVIAVIEERLSADNVTRFDKHGRKLKNKFDHHLTGGLLRLRCHSNSARDTFIPVTEIYCAHDSTPGYATAVDIYSKPENWGDDEDSPFALNIVFN
jgi:hypothetical protein